MNYDLRHFSGCNLRNLYGGGAPVQGLRDSQRITIGRTYDDTDLSRSSAANQVFGIFVVNRAVLAVNHHEIEPR